MKALQRTFLSFIIQYKLSLALCILFFVLYLPLSLKINFYQNDDWYYYKQVGLFLIGKFRLLNDIAPTFYMQGFLGAVFSYFFGLEKLPILTLIVSTLDLFIYFILLYINKISRILLVLSFVVFISFPVFSYSVLGFMSENYFLFFCLLSILFFNLHIKSNKAKFLFISLVFTIVSFFVKQNGVVFLAIYFLYFLNTKEYKKSLYCFINIISLLLFYNFIFPQTFEMKESKFSIEPFIPTNIIFYIYITLGFFGILVLPLFSHFKLPKISSTKNIYTKVLICVFLFSIVFYLYSVYTTFKIYPYFGNTFAHLGYLYGSIDGEKPVAIGMSKLFLTYTNIGPFIITVLISLFIFSFKKITSSRVLFFYFLAFIVFQGSGLFISKYFDRYLIIPFVLFLLFLVNYLKECVLNKYLSIIFIPLLIINFFISYLFSWDFVLANNYVWGKSEALVKQGVLPENIYANGAWVEKYNNKGMDKSTYIFYYNEKLPKEFNGNYTLVETKEFNQLHPFYKNSRIHLFKAK